MASRPDAWGPFFVAASQFGMTFSLQFYDGLHAILYHPDQPI